MYICEANNSFGQTEKQLYFVVNCEYFLQLVKFQNVLFVMIYWIDSLNVPGEIYTATFHKLLLVNVLYEWNYYTFSQRESIWRIVHILLGVYHIQPHLISAK